MNGGEDTQRRAAEKLADKYLRLTRRGRVIQYILYGAGLLGCAIGNLAAQHRLDWFFIVLTAVMTAASLTLVPAVADLYPRLEQRKAPLALGCFTLSLELLLLVCCLYTGGTWFPVAGTSVFFALSFVLLPVFLPLLPLHEPLRSCRATLTLISETLLLELLLLVCCLHFGGDWFPVAAVSVLFGLGFLIVPIALRQTLRSHPLERYKALLFLSIQSALLLVLLLVCCLYTGGDWFIIAGISVLFALGFLIVPVALRQLLRSHPLGRHKALLFFAIQTVLLTLLLLAADLYAGTGRFLTLSLPVALLCLILPWAIMAIIRYLPLNGWFRASACFGAAGAWLWLAPIPFDRLMSAAYYPSDEPYPLLLPFDLRVWNFETTHWNILAIILMSLGLCTAACLAAGIVRHAKRR